MLSFYYFIRDELLIQRVNNLMNPFSAKQDQRNPPSFSEKELITFLQTFIKNRNNVFIGEML